ncbi:MAG: glycosyltransferase family 4 protein [Paracoccaceae bacterium]
MLSDQTVLAPEKLRCPQATSSPVRLRYGVDYTAANPYQALLYHAIGPGFDARAAPVDVALAELTAEPGPMIYHLHWEDHPLKAGDVSTAAHNLQKLLDGLDALAAAGGQIVWTRHNLRPHDAGHLDLYAEMLPHLSELVSVIHVHSWEAIDALAAHEAVDLGKIVVIGHGNYIGHYDGWAAPAARASFGFDADDHVFLLFGRLGGYRQAAQAAKVFATTSAPNARLIIAGKAASDDLQTLPDDDRIIFGGNFVPDKEVGRYFAAADTVLLPYVDSLTSGTGMLAAGFSRGILGTDVAGLRDLVRDRETGLLYAHGDLASALEMTLKEGRTEWLNRGKAAGRKAALRDWKIFGRQWRDLLMGLALQMRPGDLSQAKITAN